MGNPVEEYLSKEAVKTQRKQNELDLWHRWNNEGRQKEHLAPLLKLYDPIFNMKLRAWKPPQVPASAYLGDLQTHAIKAFETFDPTRGVALNTHVEGRLKKALRYGNKGANLAYIPEGVSGQIGKLQKARDELTEELGRAPTTSEIADHLGMPLKRVETISKSVKRDIPMGRSGGAESFDYTAGAEHNNRGFEDQQIAVAATILPEIFPNKPEMHELFHYTFGTGGYKQVLKTSDLAKKMGKSEPQISRMKSSMGSTLRKHMGLDEE